MRVVTEAPSVQLAFDADLPDTDRPILATAAGDGETISSPGDRTWFLALRAQQALKILGLRGRLRRGLLRN